MKYIVFTIFVIFSSTVQAKYLVVTTPFNAYSIDYSSEKISLSSSHYHYDLVSNKCNHLIINTFVKKINRIFSSNALDKSQNDNQIKISIDGKAFYTRRESRLGVFLLKIPKEVRKLTIQESMLCKL
jgi:hypothetical protein